MLKLLGGGAADRADRRGQRRPALNGSSIRRIYRALLLSATFAYGCHAPARRWSVAR
jgi:hypothetical protein